MKKQINLYTALLATVIGFGGLSGHHTTVLAAESPWQGMYETISTPQTPDDDTYVEVTEVFLYTCPHCYNFEKHSQEWLEQGKSKLGQGKPSWLGTGKPEYVKYVRMPAVFNPRNVLLAKAYYTAESLGVLDTMHLALFQAIHEQGKRLETEEEIRAIFVKEAGISEADFNKAFTSFSVDNKVRRANSLTVAYGIMSVPSAVVAGKYRLSPDKTQGFDNKLKIINYLAAQEYAARSPVVETPAEVEAIASETVETVENAETSVETPAATQQ
jgi:protein dithiol oxidoreductase (disulfide-forming)